MLTKSVAGLFLLPGIAIEIIRRHRFVFLLRQPTAWLAAGLAIIPPLTWYWLRETAATGYLHAVWENELGGRLTTSLEQHTGEWYEYLIGFFSQQFLLWTPWVVASIWVMAKRPRHRPAHRFMTLATWSGGIFLLIISAASTKLPWYNAPVFPLLALLIGGGLSILARQVAVKSPAPMWRWRTVLLLAVAIIPSAIALQRRRAKEIAYNYSEPELNYGRYLRNPAAVPDTVRNIIVLQQGPTSATRTYNASLEYYALVFRRHHAQHTEVRYTSTGLTPGQIIVVCGAAAQASLLQQYQAQTLYTADSCSTFRIAH